MPTDWQCVVEQILYMVGYLCPNTPYVLIIYHMFRPCHYLLHVPKICSIYLCQKCLFTTLANYLWHWFNICAHYIHVPKSLLIAIWLPGKGRVKHQRPRTLFFVRGRFAHQHKSAGPLVTHYLWNYSILSVSSCALFYYVHYHFKDSVIWPGNWTLSQMRFRYFNVMLTLVRKWYQWS